MELNSMSKKEMSLQSSGGYTYTSEIQYDQKTCWKFECKKHGSNYPIFTEKIDALKLIRKRLDSQMKNIFDRQQEF